MAKPLTTYQKWQEGELDSQAALEEMCRQLANLDDSLKPLEETKKVLRQQIEEVVDNVGGKAEVKGYANLNITQASQIVSYKGRQVDSLLEKLRGPEYLDLADHIAALPEVADRSYAIKALIVELANELADLRQESSRSGGLRIMPIKADF